MDQSSALVPTRYVRPGWLARRVFNRLAAWLVRRGIDLAGARELTVAGRVSGRPRTTVVNVLMVDGRRFLVAPRGTTEWVRNLRVAGGGSLRVGRRTETFTAEEMTDATKPPVLRAYVDRWGWEVGQLFEGISKHPTEAELAAVAGDFPVFEIC